MKVAVAANERGESRDRPQTPCPLVQPEPKRDPNPTSAPARRRTHHDVENDGASGARHNEITKGAESSPAIKAARHKASFFQGGRRPPIIPLIPATRPTPRIIIADDRPISAPPDSALQGVKWTQSICM